MVVSPIITGGKFICGRAGLTRWTGFPTKPGRSPSCSSCQKLLTPLFGQPFVFLGNLDPFSRLSSGMGWRRIDLIRRTAPVTAIFPTRFTRAFSHLRMKHFEICSATPMNWSLTAPLARTSPPRRNSSIPTCIRPEGATLTSPGQRPGNSSTTTFISPERAPPAMPQSLSKVRVHLFIECPGRGHTAKWRKRAK